MVLFFIVALVAAYTSRNLIFEQRTSNNQYRSMQAFEAAEAGLEWALAMLNSGRIDAECQPHTDPTTADDTFRQRYLREIDTDGRLDGRSRSDGQPLRPACVFDGTNWLCSCPLDGAPSLAEPTGDGPFPAFVLRFSRNDPAYPAGSGPYPPAVIRIESTGCTRVETDEGCATATAAGDGRASVTILAALKAALATPPTAAVTVRDDLSSAPGDRLRASNQSAGGLTMNTGGVGACPADPTVLATVLLGPPGTPPGETCIVNDPLLQQRGDRMFASVFGMEPQTYRLQPAAVRIDCTADCSASTVHDIVALNPGRVVWIEGDLDFSVPDEIGSSAFPAVLVVNGRVDVSDPNAKLNGIVYALDPNWGGDGNLLLRGALLADDDLSKSGSGTTTVVYDADMLQLLHKSSGSFVRVPGSWRDF
jgi:hypothetical protein